MKERKKLNKNLLLCAFFHVSALLISATLCLVNAAIYLAASTGGQVLVTTVANLAHPEFGPSPPAP